MAVDGKYGRVTLEHGTVGEDEPVIVFRAQDKLLPELLAHYYRICEENGSPERHLGLIKKTAFSVIDWQAENRSKIPDSESSKAWMP